MTIIYKDGGKLECSSIEICGDMIYADDIMYAISIDDVERIEG